MKTFIIVILQNINPCPPGTCWEIGDFGGGLEGTVSTCTKTSLVYSKQIMNK